MTDNTNIEALPELPKADPYASHSDEIYTADQMREYGLLCRRAALSNTKPTAWRVTMPNGKERGIYSNYDEVEISINGLEGNIITPLFIK
jgi:hypothetical protein